MTIPHGFSRLAAFLAAILLAAGCGGSGGGAGSSQLRVLNAVTGSEPLEVLVANELAVNNVAFGATSAYVQVREGAQPIAVRPSGGGATIAQATANLGGDQRHTLMLYGTRSAIGIVQLGDETGDPAAGKFKLRLVGLAPDPGPLDIYVVASPDITSATPSFSAFAYASTVDFTELDAGERHVVAAVAGTKQVVLRSGPIAFADRDKVTLALLPAGGARLVNAALLRAAGTTPIANAQARLKVVNAIPGATYDFLADGAALASALAYSQASAYEAIPAGTRTVRVQASNVPGTTIASLDAALAPARDHSLFAWGTLSAPTLAFLADDNTAAPAGSARLRFVNALGDRVAVDVLVNFVRRVSSLQPGTTAAHTTGGLNTQTVTFTTAGGTATLASVDVAGFAAGSVHTVYLVGTSSAPIARLVTDR